MANDPGADAPDEPDDEAVSEDEGPDAVRGGSMTGWQRLSQTFVNPPAPKTSEAIDFAGMTDDEVRARINQIDPTERRIGLAASALAAVFALLATVPAMISKVAVETSTKPKGTHCPPHMIYTTNGKAAATCNEIFPASHYVLPLVIYLAFAVAIYVTVRIGRRAPLAFTILLAGVAFGLVYGLPLLVAGAWLIFRAYRTQKNGSPTARTPLPGYVRPGPKQRQPRSTGAGTTTKTQSKAQPKAPTKPSAGGSTAGQPRSAPTQNKRYTPKAPTKKKPPPAKAGD